MDTEKSAAVAPKEKTEVCYKVGGLDVKLNYNIVRMYLVRGTGNVSDIELGTFISLCKYRNINPFIGEAYLVKFGTSPAAIIVAKEKFFKWAESNPQYDGIESGVIVSTQDGEVKELEGCFVPANTKLVGGWAKVYRKDQTHPLTTKLNFCEYDKHNGNWLSMPATMIAKVAKVQALREAFPDQCGGVYEADEAKTETQRTVEVKPTAQQAATINDDLSKAFDEPITETEKVN